MNLCRPLRGGEPRRLTYDNAWINGLDWTPDGADIVFSSNRLGGNRLWKVRAPAASQNRSRWARGRFLALTIPRRAPFGIHPSSRDVNIWRYEVPRCQARPQPL